MTCAETRGHLFESVRAAVPDAAYIAPTRLSASVMFSSLIAPVLIDERRWKMLGTFAAAAANAP